MKHRILLCITLSALVLLALATGASASVAGAAPPLQEGPPVAGEAEAAPEAVLAPDASGIVIGPYVQNVAKTSADILWEAAGAPATTYLHFRMLGTTTWTQYTVAGTYASGKYIYKKSLAGLISNAKYEYQISVNATTWAPATAAVFITAPGASASYLAADWGDSQPYVECKIPPVAGYPDMTRFKTLLAKMVDLNPRIAMTTGDRVERGRVYDHWKADYFAPVAAAKLIPNTCVYPGFGNHEVDSGKCGESSPRVWYDDFFTWPGKVAGRHWYAYTYGCVRYIVLDNTVAYETGIPEQCPAVSDQGNWLVNELKSLAFANAKWQIVLMHFAPYTCTSLNTDADRQKIHKCLEPLFKTYGVDMVISGHRHSYERSTVDGIPYVVSAGGNAPLYPILPACVDAANPNKCKPQCNPSVTKYVKDWNFITLNFKCTDPASLSLTAYGLNGATSDNYKTVMKTIDTLTLTKPVVGGTCKTFQHGVTPTGYAGARDATVHEHYPTNLFGTDSSLNVDGDDPNYSGHQVDALLKWDISSIPSGSIVTSAQIDAWVTNPSGGQIYEIYETTKTWTETTVNWNNRPTKAATVLGTMAPTTAPALCSTTLNGSGKSIVQKWVSTPSVNFGLFVTDPSNNDGFDFDARESATASHRPKLTVCYNPPTASVLSEAEVEVADVPLEEPEATGPFTGLNSFGGVTNQGLGDATTPLAGVSLSLYGRQEGEEAPGVLLATSVSDDTGAFGFQATEPWLYDFFVLKAEPPAGLVSAGTWTIDGSDIGDGSYEWYRPQPDMYAGEFHFDVPLAPDEPTEPEVTHYLWLPTISR